MADPLTHLADMRARLDAIFTRPPSTVVPWTEAEKQALADLLGRIADGIKTHARISQVRYVGYDERNALRKLVDALPPPRDGERRIFT